MNPPIIITSIIISLYVIGLFCIIISFFYDKDIMIVEKPASTLPKHYYVKKEPINFNDNSLLDTLSEEENAAGVILSDD